MADAVPDAVPDVPPSGSTPEDDADRWHQEEHPEDPEACWICCGRCEVVNPYYVAAMVWFTE